MYNQLRLVIPDAACNLACKYCVVGNDQEHCRRNGTVALEEERLKQAIDDDFQRISIWGGEPLANKAAFLRVVAFCRKHYPDKPLGIVTNGYLINPWWVAYFNDNFIGITISHDGPGQAYRQEYDLLADAKYLAVINRLKTGLSFHSVIHHGNCDIRQIISYFEQVQPLIELPIGWQFGQFKVSSPRLLRFIPHDAKLAQLQQSYRWLLQEVASGRSMAIGAVGNLLLNLAKKYEENRFERFSCGAQRWLTLDTTGKRHFCQVACENNHSHWPVNEPPRMCGSCRYLTVCTGICPHLPDRYRKKLCIVYKLWFYEVDRFFSELLDRERSKQDALFLP